MFLQNIERNDFYQRIDEYFDHPVLYKVKHINGMSLYAIRVPCFLLNEKRYLVVLTLQDDHIPLHSSVPLIDLRWKSLMTRILQDPDMEHLPVHAYSMKRTEAFTLPLSILKRSNEISIYQMNDRDDLQISLLHTRGQEYEYPSTGNLVSALETYQTILRWTEDVS